MTALRDFFLCLKDKKVNRQVHLCQSPDDQRLLLPLYMLTALSCSVFPTCFCLPIFLSVLKMMLILLLGDEGERNGCFTDQKQGIALEQHWLSLLYHKSLWLYPS